MAIIGIIIVLISLICYLGYLHWDLEEKHQKLTDIVSDLIDSHAKSGDEVDKLRRTLNLYLDILGETHEKERLSDEILRDTGRE